MQVDIYLREVDGDREIRVPILPESIGFKKGEASFIVYDIMNLGEVAVPSGAGLAAYSWESVFPGKNSPEADMVRGTWAAPKTYDKILENWKNNKKKLNLLVVGYPTINEDVYIETYEGSATGGFGDISYTVSFIEARSITIKTKKVSTSSKSKPKSDPDKSKKSSSYTIKSGDTLWGIAVKFYGDGTKWKTIYNANKEIIEKTAKKHGKSSSQNGHWIYPGVTLTIPASG